jgi:putative transcriptional regulator
MSFHRPANKMQGSIGVRLLAAVAAAGAGLAVAAIHQTAARPGPVASCEQSRFAGEPFVKPVRSLEPQVDKGTFLVASPHLQEPSFAEAVILVIGYDRDGSMGLIINRPTEVELATALPDVEELRSVKDKLFIGGPVARHRVTLLVRSGLQPQASVRVMGDVFITASAQALRRVASKGRPAERFHVYAGYTGWAPGQLEAEIARGDWRVMKGDGRTVFDTPAAEIWPRMMGRLEGEWARRGGSGVLVHAVRGDGELELVEDVGADQLQARQRADHDLEIRELLVPHL